MIKGSYTDDGCPGLFEFLVDYGAKVNKDVVWVKQLETRTLSGT